jgi:hypothetical protein
MQFRSDPFAGYLGRHLRTEASICPLYLVLLLIEWLWKRLPSNQALHSTRHSSNGHEAKTRARHRARDVDVPPVDAQSVAYFRARHWFCLLYTQDRFVGHGRYLVIPNCFRCSVDSLKRKRNRNGFLRKLDQETGKPTDD